MVRRLNIEKHGWHARLSARPPALLPAAPQSAHLIRVASAGEFEHRCGAKNREKPAAIEGVERREQVASRTRSDDASDSFATKTCRFALA